MVSFVGLDQRRTEFSERISSPKLEIERPPDSTWSGEYKGLMTFAVFPLCLSSSFLLNPSKMTSSNSSRDQVKHSDPIAINTTSRRGRSFSLSSCSSLSSESSASEAHTPSPTSLNSQRITVPSPSGSPILSYFLGQSPTKSPGTSTFPFNRKFGPSPVLEGNSLSILSVQLRPTHFTEEQEIPAATHARRASAVVAGRFAQSQTQPLPDPHVERGTAFLRRLSLSSGPFAKVGHF